MPGGNKSDVLTTNPIISADHPSVMMLRPILWYGLQLCDERRLWRECDRPATPATWSRPPEIMP